MLSSNFAFGWSANGNVVFERCRTILRNGGDQPIQSDVSRSGRLLEREWISIDRSDGAVLHCGRRNVAAEVLLSRQVDVRGYHTRTIDGVRRFFLAIEGDIGDFIRIGGANSPEHQLANMIMFPGIVQIESTSADMRRWGGAATYGPGDYGTDSEIRVRFNPAQAVAIPNSLTGAWREVRFEGQRQKSPWRVRPFTLSITLWHELGHAWGELHGRGTGFSWLLPTNYAEALQWENAMRVRVYGPRGPSNATRRVH